MLGADTTMIIAGAAFLVVAWLGMIVWVSTRYQRVGPNEALVVYGRGPTRIVTSGGAFVWPLMMQAKRLSLEAGTVDVTVEEPATADGAGVRAEAKARFAITSDPSGLRVAAARFLDSTPEMIADAVRAAVEARLREALRAMGAEQAIPRPAQLADQVRATVVRDLEAMGITLLVLDIVSVSAP